MEAVNFDDDDEMTTMPFVLTHKHGGEYDDEAFLAGWQLGILDARLALADMTGLIMPPVIFQDNWKKQADLIAMARGMVLQVTPLPDRPGYSAFLFAPPEAFKSDEDSF